MRAKTVNESISFQKYRDPKEALGLDPFEFDVEFKGDELEANSDEPENAKKWRFKGVGIIKVSGVIDDDEIWFDIDLSDGDYIRFDSQFDIGPGPRNNEYAQITVKSEDIYQQDVLEKWMEYFEDGSIILAVMKVYEDIKLGNIKLRHNVDEGIGFKKYRDPKAALGMGPKALMPEIIQKFLESPTIDNYDWDFLNYNEEDAEAAFRIRFDEYPEDINADFNWKSVDVRESFDIEFTAIINLKKMIVKSVLTADNSDISGYKFKHTMQNKIKDLEPSALLSQVENIWENSIKEDKYEIASVAYETAETIKYNDEKHLEDYDF